MPRPPQINQHNGKQEREQREGVKVIRKRQRKPALIGCPPQKQRKIQQSGDGDGRAGRSADGSGTVAGSRHGSDVGGMPDIAQTDDERTGK